MRKLLFLLQSIALSAQVGIGTDNPHPSAILELKGNGSQGLLLPRVGNSDKIKNAPAGLIIYDSLRGAILISNGKNWNQIMMNNTNAAVSHIHQVNEDEFNFFFCLTNLVKQNKPEGYDTREISYYDDHWGDQIQNDYLTPYNDAVDNYINKKYSSKPSSSSSLEQIEAWNNIVDNENKFLDYCYQYDVVAKDSFSQKQYGNLGIYKINEGDIIRLNPRVEVGMEKDHFEMQMLDLFLSNFKYDINLVSSYEYKNVRDKKPFQVDIIAFDYNKRSSKTKKDIEIREGNNNMKIEDVINSQDIIDLINSKNDTYIIGASLKEPKHFPRIKFNDLLTPKKDSTTITFKYNPMKITWQKMTNDEGKEVYYFIDGISDPNRIDSFTWRNYQSYIHLCIKIENVKEKYMEYLKKKLGTESLKLNIILDGSIVKTIELPWEKTSYKTGEPYYQKIAIPIEDMPKNISFEFENNLNNDKFFFKLDDTNPITKKVLH